MYDDERETDLVYIGLCEKRTKMTSNRRIQNIIHTRNRIKAIRMLYTEEVGVLNVEATSFTMTQFTILKGKDPTPHPYHPPSATAPS